MPIAERLHGPSLTPGGLPGRCAMPRRPCRQEVDSLTAIV